MREISLQLAASASAWPRLCIQHPHDTAGWRLSSSAGTSPHPEQVFMLPAQVLARCCPPSSQSIEQPTPDHLQKSNHQKYPGIRACCGLTCCSAAPPPPDLSACLCCTPALGRRLRSGYLLLLLLPHRELTWPSHRTLGRHAGVVNGRQVLHLLGSREGLSAELHLR